MTTLKNKKIIFSEKIKNPRGLLVVINGVTDNKLRITELFTTIIETDSNYINGYSILTLLTIRNDMFITKSGDEISFYDADTKKSIMVKGVVNPGFLIMSDSSIGEDVLRFYSDKLAALKKYQIEYDLSTDNAGKEHVDTGLKPVSEEESKNEHEEQSKNEHTDDTTINTTETEQQTTDEIKNKYEAEIPGITSIDIKTDVFRFFSNNELSDAVLLMDNKELPLAKKEVTDEGKNHTFTFLRDKQNGPVVLTYNIENGTLT